MRVALDSIDYRKLKKINVIGTTGSGKSTISKKLATILNRPLIEIDQVFWKPNWGKPTNREFYDNLKLRLDEHPCFILDGNYTKANALKWQYCDSVIWIHPSFLQTLWQLLGRTINRLITRKELWPNTGNKESIYAHLFTKDSIFYWFLKTYSGNEVKFKLDSESPQCAHMQFIELNSKKEIEDFLHKIENNKSQINF